MIIIRDEFIRGLQLLTEGLEVREDTKVSEAESLLHKWNEWYNTSIGNINTVDTTEIPSKSQGPIQVPGAPQVNRKEIAKTKEEIQRGYGSGARHFIEWEADIKNFPWLVFKKENPDGFRTYIDPELNKEVETNIRIEGIPDSERVLYCFCDNKFCGVARIGVTFQNTEETYNVQYGHWTHFEDLPCASGKPA